MKKVILFLMLALILSTGCGGGGGVLPPDPDDFTEIAGTYEITVMDTVETLVYDVENVDRVNCEYPPYRYEFEISVSEAGAGFYTTYDNDNECTDVSYDGKVLHMKYLRVELVPTDDCGLQTDTITYECWLSMGSGTVEVMEVNLFNAADCDNGFIRTVSGNGTFVKR